MAPEFLLDILNAGGNVELTTPYAPAFIDQFVAAAKAHGGHVLVTGPYAPDFTRRWAQTGGKHFTFRTAAR